MQDLSKDYLTRATLLQLATVDGSKPWICTVYFVADEAMSVYWLSWPSRRHSKELAKNNRAAGAIVIKDRRPVIGVQLEGLVSIVGDVEKVKRIMEDYVQKYGEGKHFYDNFLAGTNKHILYRLQPERIVIFDEEKDMANPRRKWRIVKGEVVDE